MSGGARVVTVSPILRWTGPVDGFALAVCADLGLGEPEALQLFAILTLSAMSFGVAGWLATALSERLVHLGRAEAVYWRRDYASPPYQAFADFRRHCLPDQLVRLEKIVGTLPDNFVAQSGAWHRLASNVVGDREATEARASYRIAHGCTVVSLFMLVLTVLLCAAGILRPVAGVAASAILALQYAGCVYLARRYGAKWTGRVIALSLERLQDK